MPDTPPPAPLQKKRAPTLYAIIGFKLTKGLLLLALAFGVYTLAGLNLLETFDDVLRAFNLDPEKEFFMQIAAKIETITPANVRWVALGTFLYSLFSLVEGIGLVFRVSWAGWLAIGESLFFIPIEVFELNRAFSTTMLVILCVNVFIFLYLFQNRDRLFRHHHHAKEDPNTL